MHIDSSLHIHYFKTNPLRVSTMCIYVLIGDKSDYINHMTVCIKH